MPSSPSATSTPACNRRLAPEKRGGNSRKDRLNNSGWRLLNLLGFGRFRCLCCPLCELRGVRGRGGVFQVRLPAPSLETRFPLFLVPLLIPSPSLPLFNRLPPGRQVSSRSASNIGESQDCCVQAAATSRICEVCGGSAGEWTVERGHCSWRVDFCDDSVWGEVVRKRLTG